MCGIETDQGTLAAKQQLGDPCEPSPGMQPHCDAGNSHGEARQEDTLLLDFSKYNHQNLRQDP